jgi:endonuclease/exonuclease/phosphatase family metal-dependent hydrolase
MADCCIFDILNTLRPISNRPRRRLAPALGVAAAWLVLAGLPPAESREVRVATFNIENGTGEVGSAKYEAIRSILHRMDADIVSFQELRATTFGAWSNLAAELGYPFAAISGSGPYAGGLYLGYFSRFPILHTHNVVSPPGAVELTRLPFRAAIDVPDALRPLVLWTMHHKASADSADKFRRAIEAYRIVQDVNAYLADNPAHVEYVLTGDMNDDIRDSQTPAQFNSQPTTAAMPASYVLGADITFPVAYATFPTHRYTNAGAGLVRLPAFWEGTANPVTRPASSRQLDYVFLSPALMDSPLGAPLSEVYHSAADLGGGLPKLGSPLPVATSLTASDHLPIFVDLFMADFSPVLPTAGFFPSGEAGGPFDPGFATYTLTETNAFDTYWHVDIDVAWLSADAAEFWLEPFTPFPVEVFPNAHAAALPPGIHEGSVAFWNETTDQWFLREVVLTVRDHLAISPAGGLAATGTFGGPFDPASRVYTVTNKSGLSISFSATASENWLTVTPSSWLLHAGEAVEVAVSLNANALGLPIGAYADTVTFSNQVTGLAETRPVSLSVAGALCEAVEACDLAWTTGGAAGWFYQADTTQDGLDAAQSGPIGTSQSSWLETVVTGPARLGFHWKVSSRANSHYLRLWINGVAQASISGETAWTHRMHELASGIHTLRWEYATSSLAPQGANAAWLDQVRLHRLTATPNTTWAPAGIPGGPFTPATRAYVLTNSGAAPIAWTATSSVPWVSLDIPAGDLEPGGSQIVECSLNANAAALPSGTHAATLVFSNAATGDALVRAVSLAVRDALVISPSYAWFQGYTGGPFTALQNLVALSNSGSSAVTWTAAANAGWLAAGPASGYLEPGETQTVEIVLTPQAGALPAGWNSASLLFSNATTQLTQSYPVYLNIEAPLAVAPPAWAPAGPVGGPFDPAAAVYVLTNRGSLEQSWSAAASAPWLSLDLPGGILAGTSSVPVEVSLNAAAADLPMGTYAATLVFSNLTGGTALTQSLFLAVGVVFCEAVDACDLAWSFGGNAPWIFQTDVTHDGQDAAASGTLTDSQESWMQTTVAGPGSLSFYWKVHSEANWDFLEFWINGVRIHRISGDVDWQMQTYEFGDGDHLLRWRYMKDGSVSVGADRGWVDAVTWTAARTLMGVPVSWYQRFGLAPATDETWNDLDWRASAAGDPNWFQHLAGLDPTDPAAAFRILDVRQEIGGPTQVEWYGGLHGPSAPYVIQATLDLENGPWEPVATRPRAAGLNTWSDDTPAETLRFYRIQALPDP